MKNLGYTPRIQHLRWNRLAYAGRNRVGPLPPRSYVSPFVKRWSIYLICQIILAVPATHRQAEAHVFQMISQFAPASVQYQLNSARTYYIQGVSKEIQGLLTSEL